MNELHVPAIGLGIVAIALFVAVGANIATAETIEIGQYVGESRALTQHSTGLVTHSSQITGLNNGLKDSGARLQESSKDLAVAMTNLKADESKTEITVNLSADVLFDFDKANIKPEADAALQQVALIIANKRKGNVIITGYTDAKGSDSYNQTLSEKRATSVRQWFVAKGYLSPDVIVTLGKGESDPVAPNTNSDGSDNPDGRKLNRRVSIVIETK